MSLGKAVGDAAKVTLRKQDLRVELYLAQGIDLSDLAKVAVRVAHLPTGLQALGSGQGSQLKHHEKALEMLEQKVRRFIKTGKARLKQDKR